MAELSVSRKNIRTLFSELQGKKFFIPEYQRPYKWDEEKCDILWDDLQTFHFSTRKDEDEYFLGTIVTYKDNDNLCPQIIDGQQRVTTLLLLMRALYKKLESMDEDSNIKGLKNQVIRCIWDVDPISELVTDRKKYHLISLVATDTDVKKLEAILENGEVDSNAEDNYSKNFNLFLNKWDELAQMHPTQWQPFIVTLLNKSIILPIECDNADTALTIFSTLNDRGLPLSDSDIFKAQLYKNQLDENAQKEFVNIWKELSETCQKANITLDDIFRYYSHIIRAKNHDISKEIGLRKFYAEDRFSKLNNNNILIDLKIVANFWLYLNSGTSNDDLQVIQFSNEIIQLIKILEHYPNEYWKYAVTVYYFANHNDIDFKLNFAMFLKELIAFLFMKFIEKPTVNAIKDPIYRLYISVFNRTDYSLKNENMLSDYKTLIKGAHNTKLARALILLNSYLYELEHAKLANHNDMDFAMPNIFEIEHIFPKKWQSTNYQGWNEISAKEYLEKFGNKIAIEKKLNIQAGNGYFGRKKILYRTSKFVEVHDLGYSDKDEWRIEDIEQRDQEFSERINNFFFDLLS